MVERSTSHGSAWEFSDAWILAAISAGTRSDELSGLVGAADHYNHAIPTEAEVSQGIGRLLASELITLDGGSIRPTPNGGALLLASNRGGYEYVAALLAAMTGVPLIEGRVCPDFG